MWGNSTGRGGKAFSWYGTKLAVPPVRHQFVRIRLAAWAQAGTAIMISGELEELSHRLEKTTCGPLPDDWRAAFPSTVSAVRIAGDGLPQ